MLTTKLLLIDRDDYSSSLLLENLQQRGFASVTRVASGPGLPAAMARLAPDVVIFNYHFHQPDDLLNCCAAKLAAPSAAVIAIVSAGPAIKAVRLWAKETGYVDTLIEKPVSDEQLFAALDEVIKARNLSAVLDAKTARLTSLLPEGAVAAARSEHGEEAEMFETAVVFTDIRRSSDLITRMPPRDFFELLNQTLSAQSAHVRQFEGSVVKYTGDGMMAVFRGMGRSYLALRCAIELGRSNSQTLLPFGVGVAEGLVLAGLVGDSQKSGQRRQYDVIGSTVHLAARLCSMAGGSEVLATHKIYASSRITAPPPRHLEPLSIRGFDGTVACVAFATEPSPRPVQEQASL